MLIKAENLAGENGQVITYLFTRQKFIQNLRSIFDNACKERGDLVEKGDCTKNPSPIMFEKINYDDIVEMEEVVTALFGTQDCCDKGGNIAG